MDDLTKVYIIRECWKVVEKKRYYIFSTPLNLNSYQRGRRRRKRSPDKTQLIESDTINQTGRPYSAILAQEESRLSILGRDDAVAVDLQEPNAASKRQSQKSQKIKYENLLSKNLAKPLYMFVPESELDDEAELNSSGVSFSESNGISKTPSNDLSNDSFNNPPINTLSSINTVENPAFGNAILLFEQSQLKNSRNPKLYPEVEELQKIILDSSSGLSSISSNGKKVRKSFVYTKPSKDDLRSTNTRNSAPPIFNQPKDTTVVTSDLDSNFFFSNSTNKNLDNKTKWDLSSKALRQDDSSFELSFEDFKKLFDAGSITRSSAGEFLSKDKEEIKKYLERETDKNCEASSSDNLENLCAPKPIPEYLTRDYVIYHPAVQTIVNSNANLSTDITVEPNEIKKNINDGIKNSTPMVNDMLITIQPVSHTSNDKKDTILSENLYIKPETNSNIQNKEDQTSSSLNTNNMHNSDDKIIELSSTMEPYSLPEENLSFVKVSQLREQFEGQIEMNKRRSDSINLSRTNPPKRSHSLDIRSTSNVNNLKRQFSNEVLSVKLSAAPSSPLNVSNPSNLQKRFSQWHLKTKESQKPTMPINVSTVSKSLVESKQLASINDTNPIEKPQVYINELKFKPVTKMNNLTPIIMIDSISYNNDVNNMSKNTNINKQIFKTDYKMVIGQVPQIQKTNNMSNQTIKPIKIEENPVIINSENTNSSLGTPVIMRSTMPSLDQQPGRPNRGSLVLARANYWDTLISRNKSPTVEELELAFPKLNYDKE